MKGGHLSYPTWCNLKTDLYTVYVCIPLEVWSVATFSVVADLKQKMLKVDLSFWWFENVSCFSKELIFWDTVLFFY